MSWGIGLHAGGPRYPYDNRNNEPFITRWGDFDMYHREHLCGCHASLTIVTGEDPDARDYVVIITKLFKATTIWVFESISKLIAFDNTGSAITMAGDMHRRWSHASIEAYKDFLQGAVIVHADVGDALCRLDTVRSSV